MKVCRTCKVEKPLSDFNKNKRQKDGYASLCRECDKAYNRDWYVKKHPQEILPENCKRCSKCKEIKLATEFYPRGKVKLAPRCKQCCSKGYKEWRASGGKEYETQYTHKRKTTDPAYKLRFLLRLRLLDALKREVKGGKVSKKHSAISIVGCEINFLKEHLEKQFIQGMNWENHGKVWEIDHIKPCTWFNLENESELKECFHYSNLQPLFKTSREINGTMYLGNRNKRNFSSYKMA